MAKGVLNDWSASTVIGQRGTNAFAKPVAREHMNIELSRRSLRMGMTLVETLVSMVIVAVTITATINGYILSANRAEWSSQSLAAHSLAMQRLEQVRAATWNLTGETPVDFVTDANFPTIKSAMDIPLSGSNAITATIYTSITTVSTKPPLRMVRVDCVWPYRNRGWFTNTILTYRSPEQ